MPVPLRRRPPQSPLGHTTLAATSSQTISSAGLHILPVAEKLTFANIVASSKKLTPKIYPSMAQRDPLGRFIAARRSRKCAIIGAAQRLPGKQKIWVNRRNGMRALEDLLLFPWLEINYAPGKSDCIQTSLIASKSSVCSRQPSLQCRHAM